MPKPQIEELMALTFTLTLKALLGEISEEERHHLKQILAHWTPPRHPLHVGGRIGFLKRKRKRYAKDIS